MANFVGVTVTDETIQLSPSQHEQLTGILEKYSFEMEDVQFGSWNPDSYDPQNNEFGIWGHDWLNVIAVSDPNSIEPEDYLDVSEKLFEDIRRILTDGQHLSITCVGNEKLRYASAMHIEVTPEQVKFTHL